MDTIKNRIRMAKNCLRNGCRLLAILAVVGLYRGQESDDLI